MTNSKTDITPQKAAKLAGILFLFNLIIPTLSFALIHSKLFVEDNIQTVKNIIANEFLFRLSISIEIILSIGLIILGFALYKMLKNISNSLSLLAFCLKIVEAMLVVIVALISFASLQFLNIDIISNDINPENIQFFIGNILNKSTTIQSISMFFLGIEMIIFTSLLYKSKYIPRIISGLGIIAFILIFISAWLTILGLEINTLITIPSFLFELIIGLWLLIKGISDNKL